MVYLDNHKIHPSKTNHSSHKVQVDVGLDDHAGLVVHASGSGARHNLMSPREATEYFTTKGKSFSRNISI